MADPIANIQLVDFGPSRPFRSAKIAVEPPYFQFPLSALQIFQLSSSLRCSSRIGSILLALGTTQVALVGEPTEPGSDLLPTSVSDPAELSGSG